MGAKAISWVSNYEEIGFLYITTIIICTGIILWQSIKLCCNPITDILCSIEQNNYPTFTENTGSFYKHCDNNTTIQQHHDQNINTHVYIHILDGQIYRDIFIYFTVKSVCVSKYNPGGVVKMVTSQTRKQHKVEIGVDKICPYNRSIFSLQFFKYCSTTSMFTSK